MGFGDAYQEELDRRCKKHQRVFWLEGFVVLKKAEITTQRAGERKSDYGNRCTYKKSVLEAGKIYFMGGHMEQVMEELKLLNEEVEQSKSVMQKLYNEVIAVSNEVAPIIQDNVTSLRTTRMTVVSETQAMLTALRDIRKFFLESDYKEEMTRLKDFVGLCDRIKQLKAEGTLDIVSDTILRLAEGGKR